MSINVNELSFDGFSLHKWAPGFESGIKGKWCEHMLIGRNGALQEDQGDGVLETSITLEIPDYRGSEKDRISKAARAQYDEIMTGLAKRRGVFVHPLRGSRYSILLDIKESMQWTTKGNIISLHLTFRDAALDIVVPSDAASSASVQVRQYADDAARGAGAQKTRVFARSNLNLVARRYALNAVDLVNTWAAAITDYATLAVEAQSGGILQLTALLSGVPTVTPGGVTIESSVRQSLRQTSQLSHRLRLLPASMQAASDAVRLSGSVPETQATINALELGLASATRLDSSIQASLPVPITFPVEFPLSIYQIAQERYAGSGKTPQQLRALVQVMLAMNPQLRTPARVPAGTILVRPAA